MKISIIYFSKTGKTELIAQMIAKSIESVSDTEVKLFQIDKIDNEFLNESCAVIFGTPTYYSNICWQLKKWFDESWAHDLGGKIGAAFVTADYQQGGADIAALTLIQHMMVKGMLAYSGGSSLGQPYTHLGVVAVNGNDTYNAELCSAFGKRIAEQAKSIFCR